VHLDPYPDLFSVRLGTSDAYVFEEVFLGDTFDLSFLNLNPKLIIDGGANIGLTSAYFAYTYPKSKVYAIEPEKSNYKMLLRNTRAFDNIVPIQGALWNKNGTVQIKNPDAEKVGFRVNDCQTGRATQTVEALTVDKLLERAKAETIDILKLDVEGAEIEIFDTDYESWLEKTKIIIIELHDWFRKGCSEKFYSAINRYDFCKKTREDLIICWRVPEVPTLADS
jgi:FkbM family methyltransferase